MAGWDTHGLPVEIEAEKKLGISGKREIEAIGIARFNEVCRESVLTYTDEWERFSARIGYWLDYSDPYVTYHPRLRGVRVVAAGARSTSAACSTAATRSCRTARAAARGSAATRWRRATRTSRTRRST